MKEFRKESETLRRENAIRLCINAMLDGALYYQLMDFLMKDEFPDNEGVLKYNYSKSSAEKIIAKARKMMKENINIAFPDLKEKLANICFDILTNAKAIGDNSSALKAVDTIAKLCGSYEPQKQEVKVEEIAIDFDMNRDNDNED